MTSPDLPVFDTVDALRVWLADHPDFTAAHPWALELVEAHAGLHAARLARKQHRSQAAGKRAVIAALARVRAAERDAVGLYMDARRRPQLQQHIRDLLAAGPPDVLPSRDLDDWLEGRDLLAGMAVGDFDPTGRAMELATWLYRRALRLVAEYPATPVSRDEWQVLDMPLVSPAGVASGASFPVVFKAPAEQAVFLDVPQQPEQPVAAVTPITETPTERAG